MPQGAIIMLKRRTEPVKGMLSKDSTIQEMGIVPIGKRGKHIVRKDKLHHTGVLIQHQGGGTT